MGRMGYDRKYIDVRYLDVIPHNGEVRFKEYPHAKKYDQVGAWKKDGGQTDTVVNYGKFGCGLRGGRWHQGIQASSWSHSRRASSVSGCTRPRRTRSTPPCRFSALTAPLGRRRRRACGKE